jgi:hypothetical protein
MTKILWAAVAAGTLVAANHAAAEENWSPLLPGLTEGLAAGALPPPGVYFINNAMYAPFKLSDKNGNQTAVKADIFVDVPVLLWTPGIKVLGADYALGVAQPLTHVSASGGGLMAADGGHYATIAIPGQLSWSLPNDLHLLAGLSVYLPDGTAQKSVISYPIGKYAGVPNSINYWSIEPTFGISWLHDGWNISASFNYDKNFENTASRYTSGDVLLGDYTLTKALGKWTLGVVGYSVNQVQNDKSKDAVVQASITAANGNRQTKYAAGPLVGYDFGPVSLAGFCNHGFGARNVLSGDTFWTRLSVPF